MPNVNPRLNVTVTPEQHQLLLQLARVNGGSAAGYLRAMLDQITPMLRATVPAMVLAADEMNASRKETVYALEGMLKAIKGAGVQLSPDLFDGLESAPPAASESERGQGKRQDGGQADGNG